MHIEIRKHATKGFQMRIIDAGGRAICMFAYPTIDMARGAARTWTVAYGDCPVVDNSGVKQ
jgi:hypothetical protein